MAIGFDMQTFAGSELIKCEWDQLSYSDANNISRGGVRMEATHR